MAGWGAGWAGAAAAAGDWPQFRGPDRTNISKESGLLRAWPDGGPRVRWATEVCEGYAGAAIHGGRVYLNDYDRASNTWLVRCLTLAEGRELWRYQAEKRIRPNHGITRTVPVVDGKHVVALDPKCVFHGIDAATGRGLWQKNLVRDYNAQIPPWYNGQCPLLDGDRVILGIGGDALLIAFDPATGRELWRTPNPERWPLSHSSVMPAVLGGVKQYVWSTLFGVVGVDAADGRLLWHHPYKFNVAVATSPLPIDDERVFMTAGYEAGTVMIRVRRDGERFVTETVFELTPEQWNAEVHTPILYQDHLFAVGRKRRGLFTCLDLDGKVAWDSGGQADFDLGSFLLADGMFFVLEGKTGVLRLIEASTTGYRELANAPVLSGDNVWGPMALSDGKLVLRDMTKMVCIEVGKPAPSAEQRMGASDAHLPADGIAAQGPGSAAGGTSGVAPQGRRSMAGGASPRVVAARASLLAPPGGAGTAASELPSPLRGSHENHDAHRGLTPPAIDDDPFGVGARAASARLTRPCLDQPVVAPRYRRARTLGNPAASSHPAPPTFTNELRGLAIDAGGRVYAVGDSKLVIFSADGREIGGWHTERPGFSVGVAADGRVFVGQPGQIQIFDRDGTLLDAWRDEQRLGLVTAIGLVGDAVIIADTQGRCLRRYDRDGTWRNDIGTDNRMRGFLVPNGYLDFAVDAAGVLHIANAGMHRVEQYTINGERRGHFGRFDGRDPAGFPGCCNPTNVGVTPTGDIVVSEKAGPRVKVYSAAGELRAVVADDFDPNCKNMDLAVDAQGRIHVIDTVRLQIVVFEPEPTTTRPAAPEVQA